MTGNLTPKVILAAAILGLLTVPGTSYSRVNSLTGGIGTYFDYSDRSYDAERRDSNDYRAIGLEPMINFVSTSEKDRYQLRASPSIKYDLDNEETDWDSNVLVAADRFVSERWQLRFADTFIRTDYYDGNTNSASQPVDPSTGVPEIYDPTLSTNLNRRRYSRNTLYVASNYFYHEDSSFRMSFNYNTLIYDDSGIDRYNDYDRYAFNLLDEHRFNPRWKTTIDLNYVIGDYDEVPDVILQNNELSRDLKEYRLLLSVENDSITHNPLSLTYYFINTDYDSILRDDAYINQVRATWRRDFSPHLYTRLGGGPSYTKVEGSDANWGANGIAELNYLIEHGFLNFTLDKRYGVENFTGDFQRGAVDTWDSSFSFGYQLQQDLRASGSLTYIYQDRSNQFSEIVNENVNLPDSYHTDEYIAGAGLAYDFWQFYTARIDYTYINQDSEIPGDTYDDHRIVLTLSWQKELYRW